MRVFVAGTCSRPYILESALKVYLAGTIFEASQHLVQRGTFDQSLASRANILESFYYVAPWQTRNIHRFKSFMLDSGAFTFLQNAHTYVDWDEYLSKYITYINENNVELFFELDIDRIVGFDKVLEFRRRLEDQTGRRCIPVWHINRGVDSWLETCEKYDYVALGGLAVHEFKTPERVIPWMTREAHKRGCKVHGLGYTRLPSLLRTGFDSVDSSAWLYGNRGGYLYMYKGNLVMDKIPSMQNSRLKPREAARHNFIQWVRLSEEMEKYD